MIRVTIELLSAITGKTSRLGMMFIANDGTGTNERGNYIAAVCRKGSDVPSRELYAGDPDGTRYPKAARAGTVKDYPRLAYNVWRLIARACVATFPEEAKAKSAKVTAGISADVMRGLAKFAHDSLTAHGPQPGKLVTDVLTSDEIAAYEWIAAATDGPDPL